MIELLTAYTVIGIHHLYCTSMPISGAKDNIRSDTPLQLQLDYIITDIFNLGSC